jgi:polar amino acid transport system substrate-binding protein
MIQRYTTFIAVGVMIGLVAAATQPAIAMIRQITVVRPEGNWPPYEMVINDELTGVHIELIRKAAESIDLSVTFTAAPWKRAINMLKTGRADAITFMSQTDERQHLGYFLQGNILSNPAVGFATLKKYQSAIQYSGNLRDLKPFTIGTVKGYSYEYAFDHASWLKTDDGAINAAQLLRKLKAGRFKIAATYIPDLRYQAKIMGIADDIVFLKPYLTEGRTNYLVFTKAKPHAALAKRFADAITAFRSTPGYGVLLKKFGVHGQTITH